MGLLRHESIYMEGALAQSFSASSSAIHHEILQYYCNHFALHYWGSFRQYIAILFERISFCPQSNFPSLVFLRLRSTSAVCLQSAVHQLLPTWFMAWLWTGLDDPTVS